MATTGTQTTEYAQTKSATIWSIIGLILGAIIAVVPNLIDNLESGSTIAVVAGAAVSIASILQATFTNLGYIKSRTEVKVAEATATAATVTAGLESTTVKAKTDNSIGTVQRE